MRREYVAITWGEGVAALVTLAIMTFLMCIWSMGARIVLPWEHYQM